MTRWIVSALYVRETANGDDKTVENPRIIVVPEWIDSAAGQAELARVRADLERFLVMVGESAGKNIFEHRWEPADNARRYIDERVTRDR